MRKMREEEVGEVSRNNKRRIKGREVGYMRRNQVSVSEVE